MAWTVLFAESVFDDLRWFDRKTRRLLAEEVLRRLGSDPLAETRNMKTLRPNPVAERELRLGRYRALFNIEKDSHVVSVVVVGEKQRNTLLVRGEEFKKHEASPPEGS